jgi:hypothetical protein
LLTYPPPEEKGEKKRRGSQEQRRHRGAVPAPPPRRRSCPRGGAGPAACSTSSPPYRSATLPAPPPSSSQHRPPSPTPALRPEATQVRMPLTSALCAATERHRAAAPPLVMPAFVPGWVESCRCRCRRQRARRPPSSLSFPFALGFSAVRRRRAVSSTATRSRREHALASAPVHATEHARVHPSTRASRPCSQNRALALPFEPRRGHRALCSPRRRRTAAVPG